MRLFLIILIRSVLLYIGDDIHDLMPDEIKFYYQQVRVPMTRFWKVCTRCECEGLINSKTVLAMYE